MVERVTWGMSRRGLLRGVAAGAAGVALGRARPAGVRAHNEAFDVAGANALANVALPPDVGQTEVQVYVPETGHTVRGTFLDYWRANGAATVYGNPISEPFASSDGYYSQAFERAVFQYRPEFIDTADPIVRLMPIGYQLLRGQTDRTRRDGRRAGGGGDRRYAAFRPVAPDGRSAARVLADGGVYDEATAHTISGDVLAWYEAHEGHFYLGSPLSQPIAERGVVAQHFEGGLVLAGEDGVRLAPVVRDLAPFLGFDPAPVEQGDLPAYDEALFATGENPNPLGDPKAPGRHWIEVNLTRQELRAYQGSTLVSSSLVSTGIAPNTTEQGVFHVRLKYVEQDMQGFTDATGEVLGFGEAPAGTIPYEVKDVPHVMYINLDAEALHGAYWHNNFGTPMSHGCINLPLPVAAFLFGWSPLGTMVWVHE